MAKLNLTQAAKAVGIARGTLYTHIKQGKVSVDTIQKGRQEIRVIDTAELVRVYGELKTGETSETSKDKTHKDAEIVRILEQRIGDLDELNKELHKDKELGRKREEDLLGIIKQQQTLLLPAPDKKKKGFWSRLFG